VKGANTLDGEPVVTAPAVDPETRDAAFVSYSRAQADFAQWLVAAGRARGRTFWLDAADIPPAAEWRDELLQAIRSASAVVCVLTASWLASPECRRELEIARDHGKRLVTVRLQDIAYDDIPPELRSLQWIDALSIEQDQVVDAVLAAIDSEHERVRAHTRWLVDAARWESASRDRSHLPRGRELREAEAWLATAGDDPRPVPLQTEYIAAAQRAERRRRRNLLSAVSTFAVIALVLAGLALWQRHVAIEQRNAAESGRLALASQQELSADPEVALILASDAWRMDENPRSATALRAALAASQVRETVRSGPAEVLTAVAQRDGGLVTVGEDRRLRGWLGGRQASSVTLPDTPTGVVSADTRGDRGVLMTRGHHAVVWKAVAGGVRMTADVPDVAAGAVSADGSRFVLAMATGQVRDSTDGVRFAPLLDLAERGETPHSVALSADGSTVAVGGDTRTWIARGASATPVPHSQGAQWVFLSADGTTLMEQDGMGSGQVQRVSDGHVEGRFPYALTAALAPDGRHWAWGTISGEIRLVTTGTGRSVKLARSGTPTAYLLFTRDGSLLLSAGPSAQPKLWRTSDGRAEGVLAGGRGAAATVPTLAAGGRAAVGYTDGTVRVWALPRVPVTTPVGASPAEGTSLATGPDEGAVTAYTTAGVPLVFTTTGKETCTGGRAATAALCPIALAVATQVTRPLALAYAAAAPSPDGSRLAVLGDDGSLTVFSTTSRPTVLWRLPAGNGSGKSPVLAWSSDGRRLLLDQADQPLRVADTATHQVVATIRPPGSATVYGAAWSGRNIVAQLSDGRLVRYGSGGHGATVLRRFSEPIGVLATSPDGDHIAVGDDTTVDLLNASGTILKTQDEPSIVESVAFSPRGDFLAAGTAEGTLAITDVATGEPILTTTVAGQAKHVAFTDDREVAALGDVPDGLSTQPTLSIVDCTACQDADAVARAARARITLPLTREMGAQWGLTTSQLGG
jgi:WD40 repeat protein